MGSLPMPCNEGPYRQHHANRQGVHRIEVRWQRDDGVVPLQTESRQGMAMQQAERALKVTILSVAPASLHASYVSGAEGKYGLPDGYMQESSQH